MTSYVKELCAHYRRVPTVDRYVGKALTSPGLVAALATEIIGESATERFVVMNLDIKNRLLSFSTVGIGSASGCPVMISEIFKAALLANAVSIAVAHNHPSSDVTPSAEDDRITQRIFEAGRLIGIEVIDHVIVGGEGGGHYSYQTSGRLKSHSEAADTW